MKVTSKYTTVKVLTFEELAREQQNNIIIQIEKIENHNALLCEIVINFEKYQNEQPKQQLSLAEQNKREQLENEYNDALEIVLNNDPQGKWSGCTLAEILAKDVEWFKWAKAEMRNPYIKKFVCVICEHDNIK